VGDRDRKSRTRATPLDEGSAPPGVPLAFDVHLPRYERGSADLESGSNRVAEFNMSELLGLTALATGLFLILLIPGNYLIARFWHRDPSNLPDDATEKAAPAASIAIDAQQALVIAGMRRSTGSITHGIGPVRPFGSMQQGPITTPTAFEPLAAA